MKNVKEWRNEKEMEIIWILKWIGEEEDGEEDDESCEVIFWFIYSLLLNIIVVIYKGFLIF